MSYVTPGNKRILANQNVSAQDRTDFKTEISLENVDNTADSAKPVSTAQQTALDAKVSTSTTVNGQALSSNVSLTADDISDTVTTNKFATSAQLAKVDHLTVTQAVNLDQMETDIAALANGMVYKGDWDASSGVFPGAGTAQTGAFYYVSVAGTVDSISFAVGDNIVATTDNASTTTYAGNWSKHDQTDAVQSVAGRTGAVTLAVADITDAGSLAALSTVGSSELDDEAVTYAKMQHVSATDKLLGRSTAGAGDVEEIACTAAGRALLDDADASAQRTTLGLAIGTDVQAHSSVLDATTASFTTADESKLDAIEAGADVTDATNVAAAGATMNGDTSLSGNGYFLDEDTMASNDATKVPSQQSVKAYSDDHTLSNAIVSISAAQSPYSASWGERIQVNTSSGAVTVNAPTASSNDGKKFSVEKTTSDANSVTVSGVYGANTDTVDIRYENGVYQSDGSVVRRVGGFL